MKLYIIYFLLMFSFVYAQYGPNLVTDPHMNNPTVTWTASASIITMETDAPIVGYRSLQCENTGWGGSASDYFTITQNVYYKFSARCSVESKDGTAMTLALYDGNEIIYTIGTAILLNTLYIVDIDTFVATTGDRLALYNNRNDNVIIWDSVFVRQKLDTLFIDPVAGIDSNLGDSENPIATWGEHDIRGSYAGGVVVQWYGDEWVNITNKGSLYRKKTATPGLVGFPGLFK